MRACVQRDSGVRRLRVRAVPPKDVLAEAPVVRTQEVRAWCDTLRPMAVVESHVVGTVCAVHSSSSRNCVPFV